MQQEGMTPAARPSRVPIVLSAFVFPGVGQLLQRRWRAALGFGLGFLASFALFLFFAGWIIVAYYAVGLYGAEGAGLLAPLVGFAICLGLAFAVYAAGVVDTYGAYVRACHAAARQRLPPAFRDRIPGNGTGDSVTASPSQG